MTNTSPTPTKSNPLVTRIVLLVALIALFIGLNVLYTLFANPNRLSTGEAGQLIYAAGFDGFTDEWQQFEGRYNATIADGVMQMSVETADTIYTSAPPVLADFDVRVTVRATDGIMENEGHGIIFRLDEDENEGTCQRDWVILCALERLPYVNTAISLAFPIDQTRGFYMFVISNDGFYKLMKSNPETGIAEDVTIWHDSQGILNVGIGEYNQIRIVGQGNQFRFFLNDELLTLCVPLEGQQPTGSASDCLGTETTVWEDDSFSQGKIGLVLNSTGAGDVVEFDNFTIIVPDEMIIEGDNA
ncbi:MAG: hypothetical protein AAF846_07045 [Chloroflexota bacterium]